MNTKQADELGHRVARAVQANRIEEASATLAPTLAQRVSFTLLDRIGAAIGDVPLREANAFLRRVAKDKTMGGWTVIGSALAGQFDRDLRGALAHCREFAIDADVWYATDILGERVAGPALVNHFKPTLDVMTKWRSDENHWVRRCIGVGVHVWAKRTRGAPEYAAQARKLRDLLAPMFAERDIEAIKGIGWGLKTLGRYYSDVTAPWLEQQVEQHRGCYRALMLRKSVTYLSSKQCTRVLRAASR